MLKRSGLGLAAACGVFTWWRYRTRRRFRILAYHGVAASVDPAVSLDGFFVSPSIFEAHLRTLRGHYRVMPLSEMVRTLREGGALPDNAVAITFDDGYLNNYTEAAPLLAKYVLPATFFVTTGFIDGTVSPWWFALRRYLLAEGTTMCVLPDGREQRLGTVSERVACVVAWEAFLKTQSGRVRDERLAALGVDRTVDVSEAAMMSWAQIASLQEQGHEVGAHTMTHPSLAVEGRDELEQEIGGAVRRVREQVGAVSPVFAYPFGGISHVPEAAATLLEQAGCIAGVTTVEGLNGVDENPYLLRRFNVTDRHDRLVFRALMAGLKG